MATGKPPLTLLIAAPRGFCAGVDRAIRIVELALERYGAPVYVRHEIVHNKFVVDSLRDGDVALLENLRFHPEEEKNDPGFAKQLASLGDLYVNDAFSAAHRAHASTEAIARLLPNAAGKLMQAELEALEKALEKPQRPLVAIGGLTLERALLCLKSGADIAAVVGDVVNHRDPVGQAKAWIAATRRKP